MSGTIISGIDYGPLHCLIGNWQGDQGMDVAPEPDDDESTPYFETIVFEAAGDVTNAEIQTLSIVRYHRVVTRKSNNQVFHDQIGYWLWDPSTETVMQTLTIPRAVTLLAGGKASVTEESTVLEVSAADGDSSWGIAQSPFMQENARTVGFQHRIEISGDQLNYSETTLLDIYGKTNHKHTDENTLQRLS
jgi:hypothetical protein